MELFSELSDKGVSGQCFITDYVGEREAQRNIHTAAGAELGTSCQKLTNAAKSQASANLQRVLPN